MRVRTLIILNPAAGSADQAGLLRRAVDRRQSGADPPRLVETDRAGDARRLARRAVEQGYRRVVAAGGDGTVNEVVNGLAGHFARVTLGIIPLGTGNDLPRTLGIPADNVRAAVKLLDVADEQRIDLIRVRFARKTRYGVNVAAGGFTGQVNEALTEQLKATWGPLAYVRGAIRALPDLRRYTMRMRCDGLAWEPLTALNVIVANGRSAGGGLLVAPPADPRDGLLDVVIVRPGTLAELTGVAARLLSGNYLGSAAVLHRRVRRFQIESRPGMWFNIDGELLTNEPITFSVVPGALRVLAGKMPRS